MSIDTKDNVDFDVTVFENLIKTTIEYASIVDQPVATTKQAAESKQESNPDFDKLLELTILIKDSGKREYVRNFLINSPSYFRVVPASSSGKYHPKSSLGKAGLVRHTAAVVKVANYICELEFLRIDNPTRDNIISACFLHDTRKQGLTDADAAHTVKDHAKLAAELIEDKDISRMVLTHMGQWGKNKPGNMNQFIVHLADYIASRKDVEVLI